MAEEMDERMEFSSDESELEEDQSIIYPEIDARLSRKVSLENRSWTKTGLQDLPVEIIERIFQFLDVRLLKKEIIFVSRYFYDFLSSSEYWELRLACALRVPDGQHLRVSQVELDNMNRRGLERCVFDMEEGRRLSFAKNCTKTEISSSHFGDVNTVKLLSYPASGIALSGSRDKTICVYDTSLLSEGGGSVVHTNSDHNGWVWTLDQEEGGSSRIISGSWDGNAHIYELERAGELAKVSSISAHSAVLCSRFERNFAIFGTFSKFVVGYDTREGREVFRLRQHTKSVLSLASSERFIWSTGEDHALSCYDRRAGRLLKRIKFARPSAAIQYREPFLWYAGYDGILRCFNSELQLVGKTPCCEGDKITGMSTGAGVTALATSGVVRLWAPTLSTAQWTQVEMGATSVDYKGGVLMGGGLSHVVSFYKYNS